MRRTASELESNNGPSNVSKKRKLSASFDPLYNHVMRDVWKNIAAYVEPTEVSKTHESEKFSWRREFVAMLSVSKAVREIFFEEARSINVELVEGATWTNAKTDQKETLKFDTKLFLSNFKRVEHLRCKAIKGPSKWEGWEGSFVSWEFGILDMPCFGLAKIDEHFEHLKGLVSFSTSHLSGTKILTNNESSLREVRIENWDAYRFGFSRFVNLTSLSLVNVQYHRKTLETLPRIPLPLSLERLTLINSSYYWGDEGKKPLLRVRSDGDGSLEFNPSDVPNLKKLTVCPSVAKRMCFHGVGDPEERGYILRDWGYTYHELRDHPPPDTITPLVERKCCHKGACKNTLMSNLVKVTIRRRCPKKRKSVIEMEKISLERCEDGSPRISCLIYANTEFPPVPVRKKWRSHGSTERLGINLVKLLNARKEIYEHVGVMEMTLGTAEVATWIKTGSATEASHDENRPCRMALDFWHITPQVRDPEDGTYKCQLKLFQTPNK